MPAAENVEMKDEEKEDDSEYKPLPKLGKPTQEEIGRRLSELNRVNNALNARVENVNDESMEMIPPKNIESATYCREVFAEQSLGPLIFTIAKVVFKIDVITAWSPRA